ncbi:UNVERIFIED_CONTAM: hypothetical protein FKN15_026644 [Acipenser sinensis]
MDFQELIEKFKRNTAAQEEQNKKWRVELGLPEPEPTELDLLLQKWEKELPLPEPRGEELPLPEPRGEELPLPEPRGEELPLPEPRGEEPPLPELKGEEAKSIPPPQPRPPPLETSPVLLDAVSWPGLVGPLGGMPGPPSSCPSSQVTGLPGTVACLVPHSAPPNGTDVTKWESDVACAPPSPTLFPLRPQSSLRRSIGTHLCLPFLSPGHRPVFRSPLASHLGPSSPDRGPFLWAPDFKGGECGLGMADQCCALKGGKCNTAARGPQRALCDRGLPASDGKTKPRRIPEIRNPVSKIVTNIINHLPAWHFLQSLRHFVKEQTSAFQELVKRKRQGVSNTNITS